MAAIAIQEDIVFFTGFDTHQVTIVKPEAQFPDSPLGNGDEPFFAAFA